MIASGAELDGKVIEEVVAEVLRRLRQAPGSMPAPTSIARGAEGVFANVDDAVKAAQQAQRKLTDAALEGRNAAIESIRKVLRRDRDELGRIEFAETRIGRLDHKFEKLDVAANVPGVEMLRTEAISGDHGLNVTEYAPYGVIGVVTPVTHSIPTLACNAIMMIAAGNSLVCNPHPSGAKCAVEATRRFNREIAKATGIDNLICVIAEPTIESAGRIFGHPGVRMLCATGGPMVADAALRSGKRAVVAGPGNPPVVVDETADIEKAAEGIIAGAAYDNGLLCISEKEVFVVRSVAEKLLEAMTRHGGHRLSRDRMNALAEKTIHLDKATDHYIPDKAYVGKDASVVAESISVKVAPEVSLLFGETDEHNPFVPCEQMMPVLPVVPVADVNEAIAKAVHYEHGFKHTAVMWSRNIDNLTRMGRACDTTIYVKNGASVAGLGVGGEGHASFSIATPSGEGVTTPLSFTRLRRCTMVDNLRIV